jgi:cob(I)alamin adenosyltransferase
VSARATKAALGDADVERLERLIDRLEEELPPLRKFILAGGTSTGAALHVARTVCRRAERRITALDPPVDARLLRYVNRLSDLLFVLARVVNHRGGVPETEW